MTYFSRLCIAVISLLIATGAAQAALIDRGGGFIYDSDLDITWTQNANIRDGEGPVGDGRDTWANQVAWAAGLSIYDSVRDVTWSDWRLPTTLQPDASCFFQFDPGGGFSIQSLGYGCTGSEMGHLFNVDGVTFSASINSTLSLFTNVLTTGYWSGAEYAPDTRFAWTYNFALDDQSNGIKLDFTDGLAWAVRDGDVAAVPVPAAVWLFGSALLGLLGVRRVRR